MSFFNKRNYGSLEKWFIPQREQEKYKISLEYLFTKSKGTEKKDVLKKSLGHVKVIQEPTEKE